MFEGLASCHVLQSPIMHRPYQRLKAGSAHQACSWSGGQYGAAVCNTGVAGVLLLWTLHMRVLVARFEDCLPSCCGRSGCAQRGGQGTWLHRLVGATQSHAPVTSRSRSKFMLAPLVMATTVLPCTTNDNGAWVVQSAGDASRTSPRSLVNSSRATRPQISTPPHLDPVVLQVGLCPRHRHGSRGLQDGPGFVEHILRRPPLTQGLTLDNES